MLRTQILGLVSIVILSGVACAAPSDEDTESSGDAVTELKAYWADAKRLDLGDLTRVVAGYATTELNDQLTGGTVGATFEAPAVFAAQAEPNRVLPDGSEVKALDTVVSGLASRFGEGELGTEVNASRLKHLQSGADKYYVESGFSVKAGLNHGWNFNAGGFLNGTGIALGFDASAQLSSRVILAADDDHVLDLVKAPLTAAKNMRGFVYPRSVDDVRKMKAGEMFALRGQGNLGANFGLGTPLLVADPTGNLAYRVVFSAGVSTVISGKLDVQLVRLDGDEVVVDVGVENGKGVSFNASISDGWGVKGICDDGQRCLRPLEFGGKKFDVAKYVEKAVENRINSYLSFQVDGGASTSSSRVSLSRFRFHLDGGDKDEVARALEQTLKFDLRLAQAIYNRDLDQREPAVRADFDAVRAATTSTVNFGFQLLGMNIYHSAVVKKEGSFVIQTPDGAKSVLFDMLHKEGGWFQMGHGFTRTGLAAQTIDTKTPDNFRSEANLFIQTVVSDAHMDDDMIIDNLDGLIGGTVGQKVVDVLDKYGNEMQRLVWSTCPVQKDKEGTTERWDEQCNVALLDDPNMQKLKADGLAAVEPLLANLPDDYKVVLRTAANTRLILQSVGIHNLDATSGPNASFALDVRFDDKALAALTSRSKADYRAVLRDYVTNIYADRNEVGKNRTKDQVRGTVELQFASKLDAMATEFDRRANAYRLIADAERVLPAALAGKRYVSFPLGLRFAVEGERADKLENAVVVSTSHDRAIAAARLFDGLKDVADKLNVPLYDEHTATFPLLSLVPMKNLVVGMDIAADTKSTFWNSRERYQKAGFQSVNAHAQGSDTSTISGGMFNIDAVVQGN